MSRIKILLFVASLLLVSCASKKIVTDSALKANTTVKPEKNMGAEAIALQKLNCVQKVSDTKVYAENIVGDMSFNIKAGNKNITVPGSLHMRKNEVIRIQLFIPILGSEVGRLEFTPDYVLVVDRMHKEYIKGDYNQIDFLKDNGLNFYSLQSLFWNQLFIPGEDKVTEGLLKKFDVDLNATGNTLPVILKNGDMTFTWNADRVKGNIQEADVLYKSTRHGTSNLNWKYSNFKNVGVKLFPAKQVFMFTTTATKQKQEVQVTIDMDEITTKDNWDTKTTVSSKYKQIQASDILSKITNM